MKKNYLSLIVFLCALVSGYGQVNTGDLAFVQYNADGAEVIKLLVFNDIAAGESIDITDNGWLNTGSFRGGEGIFNYTVPAGGHSCGDIITIDLSNVALSASGDQLIVYQGSTIITAINSEGAGVWQADAVSANTSALPTGLTNGTNAVALNEIDNAMYNGILTGDIATLRAAIHDNTNWIGDNTTEQDFTSAFTITDCGGMTCTPPADPTGTISGISSVCAASTTLSFSGTAPANVVYYWQSTSLGTDQTNDASTDLTVTTTGDYYIRAYNTVDMCWSTGEVGPYAVTVTTATPTINTQPSDVSTAVGASASFTVDSTDGSSYQWQVSTDGGTTWSPVGTDSNLYTATNVQLTDDGNLYRVIITNACGSTTSNSATLTVTTFTLFNPGELIFVGFEGSVSGSDDELLIATLVDMTPGTEFSIVNARYEAGAAANVRTEKWGGGSNTPSQPPFEGKITYNGSTNIPAGSVLRIVISNSGPFLTSVFVTEGITTTDRSVDFSENVVSPGVPNISTSAPDQMYLMQGNFTFDGVADANEANYFFTGTLLHGITISTAWVDLTAACSGGTANSDRESRLPPELRCFNVEALTGERGYYENNQEHGLATIREIVNNVSDDLGNWNLGAYNWDPTNNTAAFGGRTFDVDTSNPAGQWVGDVDTNWFNCANWEGLAVPTAFTDIVIDGTPTNNPRIDYTANYSDEYNDIAHSNNLTISASRLELQDNTNNVLEVQGNLTINGSGILDMEGTGTEDGVLYLAGNWINSLNDTAFEEGNGTVVFNGNNPQTITYGSPPFPPGFESETFSNVVLDNDFDIAQTDRTIITTGDLTINAGRTLNVQSSQYVQVANMVINNGDFTLQDSASLIQINDVTNVGDLTMNRNYVVDSQYDYVYWSSPITNFNTANLPVSGNYIYSWDPTATNPGTGEGNWVSAVGVLMEEGKGYIARVPTGVNGTTVFQNGVPNNGDVNLLLSRGLDATSDNDDWNLIGNPYPSAISADDFITNNTEIDGYINLWTHGTDPNGAIADPFYETDNGYNYNSNDYITYNLTGTTNGPSGFTGFIAAGQAFMVNTNNGPAATNLPISFTNSMRQRDYDNSNFYRTNPLLTEKHRIWLDFGVSNEPIGERIVIGYVPNATMEEDRLYDARWTGDETEQRFYSILNDSDYLIQGRALPFSNADVIPVGFNATTEGNYTIAIHAVDGLFSEGGQDIYLRDNDLGIVHNLSTTPYSFSSATGEFNDRFEIVFTPEVLSVSDNLVTANNLIITELTNGEVQIKVSEQYTIEHVEILDVLGRQVYSLSGNSAVEVYNLSKLSNAAYIAKVTLSNGQVISKKAIKQR